jgi:hypothetical protein
LKGSIVKNKRMLVIGLLAAAVASLGAIGVVSAFNNDSNSDREVVLPVEPGGGIGDTPGRVMDPETAVKHHLSEARGVRVDDIKVVSFEKVTWPDGCRGVYFKDALCTMATVEGWIAVLVVDGPDDFEYRYHGVVVDAELAPEGDFFTAIFDLDPEEFRLGEPLEEDAN